jgi:hypothetical protein
LALSLNVSSEAFPETLNIYQHSGGKGKSIMSLNPAASGSCL